MRGGGRPARALCMAWEITQFGLAVQVELEIQYIPSWLICHLRIL